MRITLLASHTIDQLQPFLIEALARRGLQADVQVGPFNAVAQELLNPRSPTLAGKPDVIVISQLLEDVSPRLTNGFSLLQTDDVAGECDALDASLRDLLARAREHYRGTIVVHNFMRPMRLAMGLFENMAPTSQIAAHRDLNARITKTVRAVPSGYVLDVDRIASDVGYRRWFDDRLWHIAHSPFSSEALRALAAGDAALIASVVSPRRKALVLDLDNTLWGGVLGEDGLGGIKLGQTFPGNVYREFQQVLLQLHNRGVMLAINSKNNAAEVEDLFQSHPEMVLKRSHFAAVRANWQDKTTNMMAIAADLNIGLDSLAFFDDSPVERERMKGALPGVLTIDVPGGPETFAAAVLDSGVFDQLTFSDEDRRRGQLVEDEASRREARTSAPSLEDFLTSLDMGTIVADVTDYSFPRVIELLQKTNQFNLTTRRHSEQALATLRKDPNAGLLTLQVRDKFGDLGIVGAAIVLIDGPKAVIDSFLMSCRVIGRTIETAFLRAVLDWARKRGATVAEGAFVPTEKNAPAKTFYADHHFTAAPGGVWTLPLDRIPFERPPYIRGA